MFIAAYIRGCLKLRRSGMDGAGDHDQADPDHAAPTELDSAFGGRGGYRHVAPSGACPPVGPQMRVRSGRGQSHSKTWRMFVASRNARQRLGVRLSPAAFPNFGNQALIHDAENLNTVVLLNAFPGRTMVEGKFAWFTESG